VNSREKPQYEPPRVVDLGTLEEITGTGGTGVTTDIFPLTT
jgi:hypothetical protein